MHFCHLTPDYVDTRMYVDDFVLTLDWIDYRLKG